MRLELDQIEQRAGRIADPVKRLRYLRGSMAGPVPESTPQPDPQPIPKKRWRPDRRFAWAALIAALTLTTAPISSRTSEIARRPEQQGAESRLPRVWRVEHTETAEIYSNGLRVDLTFAVSNRPRATYSVFPLSGGSQPRTTSSAPVGIVFHTTESHLAPFEEDQTRRLRQLGRNALEVVREARAYHYVIDRFGRVYSVVAESDAANHAGHSIWADREGIYVNLNDSFFGVSFEGQTQAADEMTPAQTHAARLLTEMLRSRYSIRPEDCVTHAQVSVNPFNMRAGAHTDWTGNFPFAPLGLPNNYAIPPTSVVAYGFEYDSGFVEAAQWTGLKLASDEIARAAAAEHLSIARYRAILQHRYKDVSAALKRNAEGDL